MSLIKLWRAWFSFFMPAFGGGGTSSSSSSTTNTVNTDKRQVVDGSSVGVSSDQSTVNVTATDYGSIDRALSTARDSIAAALNTSSANTNAAIDLTKTNTAAVGDALGSVLGFAEDALSLTKENINLALKNTDQIGNAYKTVGDLSTGNRTLATTGLIIAGVVGALALAHKAKG